MRPLSAKKPKHLWQTVRRLLSYMGHYRLLLFAVALSLIHIWRRSWV